MDDWEWTGEEWVEQGFFGGVKKRKFKINDGRVFVASGANAPFTGFEVAIFADYDEGQEDESERMSDPYRCSWDCAIKAFIQEYIEKGDDGNG